MLTAADTFGAVEWRRVSGMNTVMTDYFALAPRHARDAILPIKHPLRTDDIHYIQAQKQTLLLYTAYDRVRARLGFQAMALLLDGEPQFLICPGGLILNTDKVSRVEGRVVALENGKRLMLEELAVRELQARRRSAFPICRRKRSESDDSDRFLCYNRANTTERRGRFHEV